MLLPLDYSTHLPRLLLVVLGALYRRPRRCSFIRDLVLQIAPEGDGRNYDAVPRLHRSPRRVTAAFVRPLDSTLILGLLFGLAVSAAVVNSFRLPWIVYLTKREKVFTLIYAFLLFLGLDRR